MAAGRGKDSKPVSEQKKTGPRWARLNRNTTYGGRGIKTTAPDATCGGCLQSDSSERRHALTINAAVTRQGFTPISNKFISRPDVDPFSKTILTYLASHSDSFTPSQRQICTATATTANSTPTVCATPIRSRNSVRPITTLNSGNRK